MHVLKPDSLPLQEALVAAVSDENVHVSKEGGAVPHGPKEAAEWQSGVAAVVAELASKQVQRRIGSA